MGPWRSFTAKKLKIEQLSESDDGIKSKLSKIKSKFFFPSNYCIVPNEILNSII